ncbi:MAG: hypothetical protein ABI557_03365 [Aureliella sp.]
MKRIRLSLTSMFVLTAFVALAIALIYSRLEIAQLTKELKSVVPIRAIEIAAQIERQTAAAKMPITVSGTMYTGNTYLITFEYFDPKTGTRKTSTFKLRYEHNGRHVGVIIDDPFLSPEPDEGGERGLRITVIDPLFAELAKEHDEKNESLSNWVRSQNRDGESSNAKYPLDVSKSNPSPD